MRSARRRALFAAVALTAALGVTVSAGAANYDLSDASYTANGSGINAVVVASETSGEVTAVGETNKNINVSLTNPSTTEGGVVPLWVQNGKLTLGDENTESVKVSAKAHNLAYANLTFGDGAETTIKGKTIEISAESAGGSSAVQAGQPASGYHKGTITLGDSNTQTINLKASTTGANWAAGIFAAPEGRVTVNGENLNIDVDAGKQGWAAGIMAQNSNDRLYDADGAATVIVNAKNTNITAKGDGEGESGGAGIVAYSGSTLTINNNLTIKADGKATAIDTRGRSTININKDKTGTVKIDGDIDFDSGQTVPNSGTFAGSRVNLNLSTPDSYIKGNTYVEGYSDQANNSPLNNPNLVDPKNGLDLKVNLSNGANWTTTKDSFVNHLTVDNATANFAGTMAVVNELNADNNATITADKLQLGTDHTDSAGKQLAEAKANIGSGASLTANEVTVNNGSSLTSEEGSTVTMKTLAVKEDGTANLAGTTNITDQLSSEAGSTVNITNLATAPKTSNLAGETHYNLGANNWNAPQTYNAQNLTVDPSDMEIDNTEGLRGGATTRKKVIINTATKEDSAEPMPSATTLTNNTPKALNIGTTLQGTGKAVQDGNDVLYEVTTSSKAQPQTHQATMAQDAGLTTVTGGFDFLAQAVDGMTEDGVYGIASVGGGEHKYDTGSHIKTNAWHAVAGVGVKNGGTQYGAFYDYGDGHYRTFADGRGDGKTIYKGAGLFGKYTFDNQMYVEGSFRAGHVKNDASDIFHDSLGNKYGLKLSSNYNAFHVGIGKVLDVGGDDTLDVYGKFFHTHIGSDSFEAGGHYDIDSVDSNIIRVGTRWNHKAGAWTHYLGVAYEYEFDGEAKGTADGARIESADIGGSSVRFELGTKVETGKWVIGFNADAYAGQHKGYDGTISAGLKF